MKNNSTPFSYIRIGMKGIVFVFGSFIWILLAVSSISIMWEDANDDYGTDAYILNYCDVYYYEKQYDELYEHLRLQKAYSDIYDKYWEVVDVYIDYQEYKKWQKVSEEDIANARQKEDEYRQKVTNAAKKCEFPQNQKYLDDFVEMLDG